MFLITRKKCCYPVSYSQHILCFRVKESLISAFMTTMGEEMHSIHSSSDDYLLSIGLSAKEDSPYTPHKVDKMRRHLRFHFMTPCEKYKARSRKPWKLILQILKIVVVTVQVSALKDSNPCKTEHCFRTKSQAIDLQ